MLLLADKDVPSLPTLDRLGLRRRRQRAALVRARTRWHLHGGALLRLRRLLLRGGLVTDPRTKLNIALVIGAVVLVLVLVGGGFWWFLATVLPMIPVTP